MKRAKMISNLIQIQRICRHQGVHFRVFSGAKNALEWRSPRELGAFEKFLESVA
jgi:RNase P/RNase MRP subunit p30